MLYDSAGLLLAAAAGYWVLERAQAQKKGLKRAGKFIGWVIIVVSFIGIACRVWTIVLCQTGQGSLMCPMPKKMGKSFCPFTPKAPSSQSAETQ